MSASISKNSPYYPEENCLFCESNLKGKAIIYLQKIYETEHWNVLLDRKPVTYGHMIITSKKHHVVRTDLNREENQELFDIQEKIKIISINVFGHSINIQYEKNGVGQGIKHFQIHYIPIHSFLGLMWVQVKLIFNSLPIPKKLITQFEIERFRNNALPEENPGPIMEFQKYYPESSSDEEGPENGLLFPLSEPHKKTL